MFGKLMEQATGGKIKVNVYAADQLTNGNQSEGIQALMDGDPVQISMHSNLIYSSFDPRFNVVSYHLYLILHKKQMLNLTELAAKNLMKYFHLMVYIVWVWLKTDLENLQIVNAL